MGATNQARKEGARNIVGVPGKLLDLESLKCILGVILQIVKCHIKYTKDNTFQDFEYMFNFVHRYY